MCACLECGKSCDTDSSLHKHLRIHKLNQEVYYLKHFPRKDKLTNEPIEFKSKEHYFSSDFNSKENLKSWLFKISKDGAKQYIRDVLANRKNRKNLIYTPSQVELKTIMAPDMIYMESLFGSYYAECESLGFKNKYNKTSFSGIWKDFQPYHKIIKDTREQFYLSFPGIPSATDTLHFGDYQLNDDWFTHYCAIERKSVVDFYGTMSNGFFRFCRELDRVNAAGYNMIVLVEGSMQEIYEYSKTYRNGSVEYVFHNMREICQKYPMVQFLFVDNREESVECILKIFKSDGQYKNIDLQYAYDSGGLI